MNEDTENLISAKTVVFKKKIIIIIKGTIILKKYKALQGKLENLIESSQQSYYDRVPQNLSSISSSSKCYSLLKRMLNHKNIPVIPPLFRIDIFIANFKEKRKLFNEHFSKHCSLIQNSSTLSSVFALLTHTSLLLFQFTAN